MTAEIWKTTTITVNIPQKSPKPIGGKDKDGFIYFGLMRGIDIDDGSLHYWRKFCTLVYVEEEERKLYTKLGDMIGKQLYKEVNKFIAYGGTLP